MCFKERRLAMVPEEKRAWFGLAVFGVSLVAFLVLLPFVGIGVAWAAFALLGLYGLSPLFFKKAPSQGEVAEDERDKRIAVRANLAAHVGAYMAAFLSCLIPWFVYRWQAKETVAINALPNVVFAMMFAFIVFRCVAILFYYHRGVGHDEA